jgi:hypothetical protein
MLKKFYKLTFLIFPSIPISAITYQLKIKPMSITVVFPAPAHQELEKRQDSSMLNQASGSKPCAASLSVDQVLFWWKTLSELSIEGYEQSLPDSEWLDLKQRLKLSARRSAVRLTRDKEYLSLPTPTTLPSSNGKGGRAGQHKLELTLKSQGRLSVTQKLNPELCLWMMAFPTTWLECITKTGGVTIHHHKTLE